MLCALPVVINLMLCKLGGKPMERAFVDTTYKAFDYLARQKF